MKLSKNVEIFILIFCIIVLSFLSLRLIVNHNGLSCENCEATFYSDNGNKLYSVKMNDIYEAFIDDVCYVEQSPNGFVLRLDYLGGQNE